jgi:hypothetical protein
MPKTDVDYSNTIIYKIYCKDESIKDIYVGHTTNFTQRKYSHKINSNNLKNNVKIYETIRHNGGWDNWDMIEIAKYCCKDATEARIKETYHYNELKASLNSCPPYVDMKKYFCLHCNIQCYSPSHYKNHLGCIKHKISTIENNNVEKVVNMESSKSSDKFVCELCKYSTSRYSQYQRHIETDKHQNNEKSTSCQPVNTKLDNFSSKFICECGKKYKERTGLWKHKKNCPNKIISTSVEEKAKSITDKDELIMFLIKECTDYKNLLIEQQSMMMKVIENGVGNNTNISNNNNNNNNKTFNLQVFLNETCKDAMNITDFVNSIKLQLSDLEKLGEVGYVEGISNIITTNLKAMDVTLRPVHCTDKKRETVYVKDENQWTKEDDTKAKLRKAIKRIADKNIRLLPQFREKYPEYSNSSSKISDKYDKMVIEVMTTDIDKEDKIIRNISNATTIEKMINQK